MLKTTDETIDITQQTPHMSLACGSSSLRFISLVVVDNGLVLQFFQNNAECHFSLNPYCSGQWSRTLMQAQHGCHA